jgi:hypothetical protein
MTAAAPDSAVAASRKVQLITLSLATAGGVATRAGAGRAARCHHGRRPNDRRGRTRARDTPYAHTHRLAISEVYIKIHIFFLIF